MVDVKTVRDLKMRVHVACGEMRPRPWGAATVKCVVTPAK